MFHVKHIVPIEAIMRNLNTTRYNYALNEGGFNG